MLLCCSQMIGLKTGAGLERGPWHMDTYPPPDILCQWKGISSSTYTTIVQDRQSPPWKSYPSSWWCISGQLTYRLPAAPAPSQHLPGSAQLTPFAYHPVHNLPGSTPLTASDLPSYCFPHPHSHMTPHPRPHRQFLSGSTAAVSLLSSSRFRCQD